MTLPKVWAPADELTAAELNDNLTFLEAATGLVATDVTAHNIRITALEVEQALQDARITATEVEQGLQDARLTALEVFHP